MSTTYKCKQIVAQQLSIALETFNSCYVNSKGVLKSTPGPVSQLHSSESLGGASSGISCFQLGLLLIQRLILYTLLRLHADECYFQYYYRLVLIFQPPRAYQPLVKQTAFRRSFVQYQFGYRYRKSTFQRPGKSRSFQLAPAELSRRTR